MLNYPFNKKNWEIKTFGPIKVGNANRNYYYLKKTIPIQTQHSIYMCTYNSHKYIREYYKFFIA